MDLSYTEEQEALVATAREFTRKEIIPKAAHYDETGEFPREILKKAWETGLMNIEIPDAYGGLGGSCVDNCLVQEEVAFGCTGINTSLSANSLGAMPLLIAGTDAQKKEYLSRLTSEFLFSAYCCSEPDAGSDVAGMRTRVTKHGDDYVLNGQKRWITNGGVANFYTVFATFDPAMKHKGIACFVVDANTPGVKPGRKENKMGQRASNTTDVIFEDCKLPKTALVGPEDGGFKVAMKTFDRSRPWIAAGAAGIIRRSLEAPLRQIAENTGKNGGVVVEEVLQLGGSKGYDALNDKYVDMFEAGIVDPTKVTRSALQNAASVASLMLTTETLITDLKDKKKMIEGAVS